MKKAIACVVTVGVLSAGAGGAAFAAEGGGGDGSAGDPPTTEPTKPATGDQGARRAVRRAALRVAAQAAAAAIGVETTELRDAFMSGQSVAELAASKGVDVATVKDAIVAALSDKIDQALSDGKVDATRAATAKERLPDIAERLVNRKPGSRPSGAAGSGEGSQTAA